MAGLGGGEGRGAKQANQRTRRGKKTNKQEII